MGTNSDDDRTSDDVNESALDVLAHREGAPERRVDPADAGLADGLATIGTHPLATLFPLLEGREFAALVADVKENGLRMPIMTMDDLILDGRNRYRACKEAGIRPGFQKYTGDDPLGYVLSANLRRRHLNESQRAITAAKVANMRLGDNQHARGSANLPTLPISQTVAASKLGVSPRSLRTAKRLLENGPPELVQRVERGEMTVSRAAKIARFGQLALHSAVTTAVPADRKIAAPTFTRITVDVVRWSTEQAGALRAAGGKGHINLPIDWETVADKIADVGKDYVRKMDSLREQLAQRVLRLLTVLYERRISTGGPHNPMINRERRAIRGVLAEAPHLKRTISAVIEQQQGRAKAAAVDELSNNVRREPRFDPALAGPSFTVDELLNEQWFPERLFKLKVVPGFGARGYQRVDARTVQGEGGARLR
jgi:hypothetical protein